MNIQRLSAIAEIVSSVAIVATLVYLGIQARQTNELLIGGSRQAALSADLSLFAMNLANPDVAARILGASAEQIQENSLLNTFMRAREYQWMQYRSGSLDRMTFESYMQPVKTWLQTEIGADYWRAFQETFDPEFTEFTNEWIVEPGNR